MKTYSLRVWPNGEFGLGYVRRFNREFTPPEPPSSSDVKYSWTLSELISVEAAIAVYGSMSAAMEKFVPGFYAATLEEITPLGSSNVSNSHKRKPRGSGGITSYGKRMLRNGCYLLEQWAGKRNIAMVTCTLPPGPDGFEQAFSNQWAEIVRIFTQWLHRRLKAAGGCPWVLGCTEVQPQRQARDGGLPLHLHVVFQARVGKQYTLTPSDICAAWERAVVACIPQSECLSFEASTRIEGVKKSVTRYLSKYISKGSTIPAEDLEEQGYKMPSSWWHGVGKFKKAIARLMITTCDEDARMVHDAMYDHPELFGYIGKVFIGKEGEERCIGWYGTVLRPLHRLLRESSNERKTNQNVLVNQTS